MDSTKNTLEEISNLEIDQNHTLKLPPQYQGSNIFMPSGERLYWQAEVVPQSNGPTKCQDFEKIQSRCLSDGVLFKDPEFPARNSSIYCDEKQKNKMDLGQEPIQWLRPRQIVKKPHFYVDGMCRFDVKQGELGDCWMDAALATLTLQKTLFDQVVPSNQSFGKDYAGIFHFRFWYFGRWVDVVIDDRLPTRDGELIFMRSNSSNEFWSALLEKAYAKLYGSYGAIVGGLVSEALEDFSGGLLELYSASELQEDFFCHLLKAFLRKSLLGADLLEEDKANCGLIGRHSYSITGVMCLDESTQLVRLRNPWGFTEWKGVWSDRSSKWKEITEEKKEALGLVIKNDGEFWMTFEDFTKHFTAVTICSLNPNFLYTEEDTDGCNKKVMSIFEDSWVKGETAGGSDQFPDSHWRNPQYVIKVTDIDDGDGEKQCTVILFLTQKNGRSRNGKIYHSTGFRVYRIKVEPEGLLDEDFFSNNKAINAEMAYLPFRSWNFRLKVEPGSYVVVPSTEKPEEEGEFLMRVLTEKAHSITKLSAKVHDNDNIESCNDIECEIVCNDLDNDICNDVSVVYI